MAKIDFGGVTENVVTREEYPLALCRKALKNETIAVIGYGVQAPAQALNLKDNGFKVIVGARKWDRAKQDGWKPGVDLFSIEEACQKDSLDMTDADRADIRQRVATASERYVVITHGTDTMTDTANVLADIPDKVIVLTGAMAPAKFRSSDATFNIGCAIGAVQLAQPGVYIAMNGRVLPAGSVRKNREKGRFEIVS